MKEGEYPDQDDPTARSHAESQGSVGVHPLEDNKPKSNDALLDAALVNLNIAQQYIDESMHMYEHRLASFHHAVALLAKYRSSDDAAMLGLARQYFLEATNWPWHPKEKPWRRKDAFERIVCEAHYNLGVIDELRGDRDQPSANGKAYQEAIANYSIAIDIADRRDSNESRNIEQRRRYYLGVNIVSRLGRVSCQVKTRNRTEALNEISALEKIMKNLEQLRNEEPRAEETAPPPELSRFERARRFGLGILDRFPKLNKDPSDEKDTRGVSPGEDGYCKRISARLEELKTEANPDGSPSFTPDQKGPHLTL